MRKVTLAGALVAVTLLFLLAGSGPAHAFSPTYSMNIDDDDMPNELLALPDGDDCATNTLPFPGGIPCEMYQTSSIPAGDPMGRFDTSIPKPEFSIASSHPAIGGVANGTQIGALGFTVGVDVSGCIPGFVNLPYPTVALVDAALPDYSMGPWAGSQNGMPLEGPDVNGPAAVFSPLVWAVDLESDPLAAAYIASGAPLFARYWGIMPTGGSGTPINLLVFDVGTAYFTTYIVGDPLLPSTTTLCTPFTTTTDFLGSTTDVGTGNPAQLRQCNVAGSDVVTAIFRPTVGLPVNVTDAVSCSLVPAADMNSSGDFCITGNSTGVGWAWRIYAPTSTAVSYPGNVAAGALLTGSPPEDIALEWADSIDGSYPGVTATVPAGSPKCFHVELDPGITGASATWAFDLYVSTGGAECKIVPPPGCSFNPIVYYVSPVGGAVALAVSDTGSSLPVTALAASAAGALILLALGSWYGRRRWLR